MLINSWLSWESSGVGTFACEAVPGELQLCCNSAHGPRYSDGREEEARHEDTLGNPQDAQVHRRREISIQEMGMEASTTYCTADAREEFDLSQGITRRNIWQGRIN